MSIESDHPHVRVPPPLVFVAFIAAALLLQWVVPLPSPWAAPFRLFGALAVVAGFALAGSCFSLLVRAHTSPDPDRPTTTILTDGPYRFTRNPIYLGFFLVFLGFTFLAGTLWGILLSPFLIVTINLAVIRHEEAYLEGRFAEQYAAYRSRVRRWI